MGAAAATKVVQRIRKVEPGVVTQSRSKIRGEENKRCNLQIIKVSVFKQGEIRGPPNQRTCIYILSQFVAFGTEPIPVTHPVLNFGPCN